MSGRQVSIYYGNGRGKTAAALGCALHEAIDGGTAIVIQFLKKKTEINDSLVSRLEPEVKVISFQKSHVDYIDMEEEDRLEENLNMKNALHYARKVMMTGECSLLVLDEILGLVDFNIMTEAELVAMMDSKPDDMELVLTGRVLTDAVKNSADAVYEIMAAKRTRHME